ncbi:MAG: PilZ domain-containing protein [Idiomarina sp.]|nr:PilZ domain-containing protein [Idiomarina sp.]
MTDRKHDNAPPSALERYQEYYAIQEPVPLSVIPMPADFTLPEWDDFEQEIPEVFRLANDIRTVDLNTSRALRGLGDFAEILNDILHQQNTKLNLLLGYILSREDDAEHRYTTLEYGGGGVRFIDEDSALELGTNVQVKLFLRDIAAAVYAYADVAAIETTDEGTLITAAFTRIRDDDREIIVRASLHAQSRLLKKRAEERGR